MSASYGSFSQCEINDVQYDFLPSSQIGLREQHLDTKGLSGTTYHSIERNLANIYRVDGQMRLYPSPTDLTTLLPICLGTAVSTITYALSEAVTGYTYVVDRVAKVHTYAGVKVDRTRFHSEQGSCLGVDLDLVGTTESEGASGSFSSTGIDVATKPWNHHMLVVTVDGTTVTPRNFEWSLNRNIDRDRYFNSQSLSTGTNATDAMVGVSMMLPYGDFYAIYTSSMLNTGVPVVATYTNGVYILTFTFAKVAFPKDAPAIESRGEIFLPLNGVAMKSGSTLPVVTTMAIS